MNVDSDMNRKQINILMRITFVTAEYIAFIFTDMVFSLQMSPKILWMIKVQQSLADTFGWHWMKQRYTTTILKNDKHKNKKTSK